MTELSYTAWDDNKYQWPPPEGWYQASDGKWWPEGYGPVAASATVDETAEAPVSEMAPNPDVIDGESADGAAEFESGHQGAIIEEHESVEAAESGTVDASSDFDTSLESEVAANGMSEHQIAEPDDADDLDGTVSDLVETTETAYPSASHHDSESPYSASSAGMAASGFGSRAEAGSSSLGLAGWAQAGGSEVRNQVDISHEYDYSAADGESEDLLDPVEVADAGTDLDIDASGRDASDVEAAGLDATDVVTADHDTTDLDTTAQGAQFEASTLDTSTVDLPAEPIDGNLSRLDDLKRQVEQQGFSTTVAAADPTTHPASDFEGGFDPTETLDIEPNDLALESNPYYGGADETDIYAAAGPGAEERSDTSVHNGDYGTAAHAGVDDGYGDPVDTVSESFGYSPVGEATTDAPGAAEARHYGYEGEAPAPTGDPTTQMVEGHVGPQNDQSVVSTLTPTSTPPPRPGPGRLVLYGVIGLVALAVAGVAGYLLFQLQSDDGDTSGGDASTATVDGDAGPSDLTGQEPGSFSNPHALAGGVRLTVPIGDDATEVWMLQVREPATTTEMSDGLVEVTGRIRIRNDSPSGDVSASGLRFVLVSADGSTATTAAASCSSGDDLNRQASIAPGQDIEGNVCWTVPAAQATDALLGIESVNAGGRVHVQLS